MRVLIVLLLGQIRLDLAQVEQLSRELESQGQRLFQLLAILFQAFSVQVLNIHNFLLIFVLSLLKLFVPMLVELLVLLNVSSLALFSLLLVIEEHFLHFKVVLLLFQLSNSVLGHLSLYTQSKHKQI